MFEQEKETNDTCQCCNKCPDRQILTVQEATRRALEENIFNFFISLGFKVTHEDYSTLFYDQPNGRRMSIEQLDTFHKLIFNFQTAQMWIDVRKQNEELKESK